MEFGELQDVDLREAWPNEASDFTPWLAENLERLSAVIRLPLELEATEVSVEGFSADILARIPADGSLVVIENQLEGTDHTHLGQILTYLAGLEAQTVIWIARRFHSAHLSAIRWLNEHTTGPFAFFAVTVRVVRIGDAPSPVAPLFEVVERPDEWNRQVQVANQTSDNSRLLELRRFRQDFWQSYVQRYPDDLQLRPNHIGSNVYHRIGGMVVSQYLAQNEVGIYLRTEDRSYGEEQYQEMDEHVAALQSQLELREDWPSGDLLNIDSNNRDKWPQMIDWLHERLMDFRRIIEQGAPPGEATPEQL